jgi:predicted Zn-dependent protease
LIRQKSAVLLLLAAFLTSCAPVVPPVPVVAPQGDDRYLIDPRAGHSGPGPAADDMRFENAWRHILAGNDAEARTRLTEVLRRNPDYKPALLAGAALDIRAGRLDEAQTTVDAILSNGESYMAAEVYAAEIATRRGETRPALELYRAIAAQPDAPPTANERVTQLQAALFNELQEAAKSASDADAVRLLREALALNAEAADARILLSQKLIAQRRFDEARRELTPLLDTQADRTEVQEMLAEIDFGRGKFEEAIARYDRLSRRTSEPRFTARLEQIKREWSLANMPSHFRAAVNSHALTRADFATLLFWTVPSIRFAQNVGAPPIAVDIEEVGGREEMVRAIAIGVYEVDPVTRRVGPFRTVTAGRLAQTAARILQLRGASCARGIPQDQVLNTCGVRHSLHNVPADSTVTGVEAQALLEQIAKLL